MVAVLIGKTYFELRVLPNAHQGEGMLLELFAGRG